MTGSIATHPRARQRQPKPQLIARSRQKKLDATLFKAVRDQDGLGVKTALAKGANPRAVWRGMTPLKRAMKCYPHAWSPVVVGTLMEAAGDSPVFKFGYERRLLIERLVDHAQTAALAIAVNAASGEERDAIVTLIRTLLACSSCDDEGISSAAKVVFASAADAEKAASECKASWLHEVVCGGDAASIGIRLTGLSEWHWTTGSDNPANIRVLDHILSLRPRLDVRWLGMTPLHLAAFIGDEKALDALLQAGADPDLPDGNEDVVGAGYGEITDKQLALIEQHRLRKSLRVADSAVRARL